MEMVELGIKRTRRDKMNRMQIFVYDKNTRNYGHEKCEIRLYDKDDNMLFGVVGDYTWQNRTWQRYDYEKAILHALNPSECNRSNHRQGKELLRLQ